MNIREIKKSDLDKILDLFAVSDPLHIRSNKFYLWRNFDCNFGRAYTYIMEDENNKIIAHYSILPQKLKFKESNYIGGLGQQALVHPEYRNLDNILNLVNYALDKTREKGINFVYGFPNQNFYKVQDKIMKWSRIKRFNAKIIKITAVLNKFKDFDIDIYSKKIKRLTFEDFNKDKLQMNQLISNSIPKEKINISANTEYIKWRFFENPENYYVIFGYENKGFIILKYYYNGEELIGHIIDSYSINEKVKKILYKYSLKYFKKMKIKKLVIWDIPKFLTLKKVNYENGFTTNFYSKNLSLSEVIYKKILDFNNWNIKMHFSDAF